jgi:hypothetical protein
MTDFKKQGGVLTGREERYDGFEGEPKAIGSNLGGHHTSSNPLSSGHHTSGLNSSTTGSTTGSHTKPSLADKLNPFKDSDKDGKKGFME